MRSVPSSATTMSTSKARIRSPDCAPAGTRAVAPEVVEHVDLFVSDRWSDLARVTDSPARRTAGSFARAFAEHHMDRRLRAYDLVPRGQETVA